VAHYEPTGTKLLHDSYALGSLNLVPHTRPLFVLFASFTGVVRKVDASKPPKEVWAQISRMMGSF